jgi:2-hydroxychromene-2-carboxylate isomerase
MSPNGFSILCEMDTLEFFFDCSSPWTYLAFENVLTLDLPVEIVWRPFLVGGVFNTVNDSVYQNRAKPIPAKARYYAKDLADWARVANLAIGQPPVFPVNSVKVMRGAFVALEHDRLVPYARAAFQHYWGGLEDISQDEVIAEIIAEAELDAAELFEKIASQPYKDKLRANTDELIERGGFGSPTFYLNGDDMYFGNDRLPLIQAKLSANR